MIEIYEGDGKGKTTAAVGLAVRALGNGIPVIFVQFLKDGSSGELAVLRSLAGAEVVIPEVFYGFVSRMSEEERAKERACYREMVEKLRERIAEFGEGDARGAVVGFADADGAGGAGAGGAGAGNAADAENASGAGGASAGNGGGVDGVRAVVVLDEVLHAVHFGLLDEGDVLALLDGAPWGIEFVLTGRGPSEGLLARADYITHMGMVRHPYERGVAARRGIEL